MRIDIELVERKIFKTRSKAQEAIKNNIVFCNGKCIDKSSYIVNSGDSLEIVGEKLKYVSRGGLKLEKAIKIFDIDLNNKIMCDIGSSTGGFSDCALQNNIKKVIAIDVGHNQFDDNLKQDNRISLFEGTDFRNIDKDILKEVEISTIDISFISVTKIINKLSKLKNLKEIICLVKPQFECGKEIADRYKGIILDKNVHYEVLKNVIESFKNINFFVQGITNSPIKGGSGNIEYLLYLKKNVDEKKYDLKELINKSFK